ncbi:MAG: hypothetical protein MJZ82_03005 [Paludibacteraceae bacterium]|nr:hypothetical protein [Paludibacteraceae bacterium]
MSAFCIYLNLPTYLAQWYAYECRAHHFIEEDICPKDPYVPLNPVEPIRNSQESRILEQFLQKQPSAVPEPVPEDATIAIAIPYYRDKDPRTYNYLGAHAKLLLAKAISERFKREMWDELHCFLSYLHQRERKDELIYCFMENHGIELTETNWLAIDKIYQRARDVYRTTKSRKKLSTSGKKIR